MFPQGKSRVTFDLAEFGTTAKAQPPWGFCWMPLLHSEDLFHSRWLKPQSSYPVWTLGIVQPEPSQLFFAETTQEWISIQQILKETAGRLLQLCFYVGTSYHYHCPVTSSCLNFSDLLSLSA